MNDVKSTIRIEDAIKYANDNGRKVTKRDISDRIWPKSTEGAKTFNMRGLCKGETKKVNPEWIEGICELTGVDANFLFGIAPMETPHDHVNENFDDGEA